MQAVCKMAVNCVSHKKSCRKPILAAPDFGNTLDLSLSRLLNLGISTLSPRFVCFLCQRVAVAGFQLTHNNLTLLLRRFSLVGSVFLIATTKQKWWWGVRKIGLNGSNVLRPDNLLTLVSRFSNASASMGKTWQATAREHDSLQLVFSQPCNSGRHRCGAHVVFWGVQALTQGSVFIRSSSLGLTE